MMNEAEQTPAADTWATYRCWLDEGSSDEEDIYAESAEAAAREYLGGEWDGFGDGDVVRVLVARVDDETGEAEEEIDCVSVVWGVAPSEADSGLGGLPGSGYDYGVWTEEE